MLAPRTSTTTATTWPPLSMAEPDVCAPIDANGNLTGDGARTFSFNAADKLVRIDDGTKQTNLSYGASGMLARTIVNDNQVVTSDVADILSGVALLERRSEAGTAIARLFSSGEQNHGVSQFYAQDHLGSIHHTLNSAGAAQASTTYDPFGRVLSHSGTQASVRGYAGYRSDLDGGLLSTPYRQYDPNLGRWLSRDPLGNIDGPNRYAYVRSNPIAFLDPLGLMIRCSMNWREQQVRGDTRCGAGANGCTSLERLEISPPTECRPDGGCPERFGFDAFYSVSVLIEYNRPPGVRSGDTPGATLRQHEMLHLADVAMFCRDLNDSIQSEGFMTRGLCNAAREGLLARFRSAWNANMNRSRTNNDKKWIR